MASGVMHIKYGSEQIAWRVRSASGELSGISSSLNSIRNTLNRLPERSSSNNLSHASSFLRKKQQDVTRRSDALETLKERSADFMSHVQTAERQLSNNIKRSYKQFHKATGIGQSALAFILEKALDFTKKFVKKVISALAFAHIAVTLGPILAAHKAFEVVKNWYEKGGKYIVDFAFALVSTVVTAALLIGSIVETVTGVLAEGVTFGAATILVIKGLASAAVYGTKLVSDFGDLIRSGKALFAHHQGNEEYAHELHTMSSGEFLFGRDSTAAKVLDGANLIIDIISIAKGGYTLIKKGASSLGKLGKGAGSGILDNITGKFTDIKNYVAKNGFSKAMKNLFLTDIFSHEGGKLGFEGFKLGFDYLKTLRKTNSFFSGDIKSLVDILDFAIGS